MNRTEAINWVQWVQIVCTDLRASRAKTLAHLVAAARPSARTSLAEIGRR